MRAFFLSDIWSRGQERMLIPTENQQHRFYSIGYEDGYKHGRLHGLIDGRALGAEKGFELWEELGFYEGSARLWTAIAAIDASGTDTCVFLSLSSSRRST